MLKESGDVRTVRNYFLGVIKRGNCPAMCKMKYWAQLKNAVVREAFRKVGQTAPYEALEEFGLTRPCVLLEHLREMYADWKRERMSDFQYAAFVEVLKEDMLTLHGHGDIDDATRKAFEAEYAANLNELNADKKED